MLLHVFLNFSCEHLFLFVSGKYITSPAEIVFGGGTLMFQPFSYLIPETAHVN